MDVLLETLRVMLLQPVFVLDLVLGNLFLPVLLAMQRIVPVFLPAMAWSPLALQLAPHVVVGCRSLFTSYLQLTHIHFTLTLRFITR